MMKFFLFYTHESTAIKNSLTTQNSKTLMLPYYNASFEIGLDR